MTAGLLVGSRDQRIARLGTNPCWSSDPEHSGGHRDEVAPLDVAPAVRTASRSAISRPSSDSGNEAVVSLAPQLTAEKELLLPV